MTTRLTRMARGRVGAAVVALGALGAACQVLAGIDHVDKVPPPVDASADADPDAPERDPCEHALPPRRPEKTNTPGEDSDLEPLLLAVRTLSLVPRSGAPVPGFDLDGVCTCETKKPTAGDGGATCRPREQAPACDYDGGIDNQAATLFAAYTSILEIDEQADINDEINRGAETVLLYMSGYNGLPNDPSVNVGLLASEGLFQKPPDRAGCDASVFTPRADAGPEGGFWSPTWCGEDSWSLVEDGVIGKKPPLVPVRTGNGWVANGTLVIEVNDPVHVPFAGTILRLGQTKIVAKLVALGDDPRPRDAAAPPRPLFALRDGVFAGRITSGDLLALVGTLPDPASVDDGAHLCNAREFAIIRDQICSALDIASIPQRDLNLGLSCDALSAAFGFEALPALDGELRPASSSANECRPGPDGQPVDATAGVGYACPPPPEAGP